MGEDHPRGRHQGRLAVTCIEDLTALAFHDRRAGCAKAVLHQDAAVQISVFRVHPGSGVPLHRHSRVSDFFMGVKGEMELRWDGGHFMLKPNTFIDIPPGVWHEVWNRSEEEGLFLLVHAPFENFDFEEQTVV
jgi:mannose-6-phosphate isomerase-like protein (cupin superfamily)